MVAPPLVDCFCLDDEGTSDAGCASCRGRGVIALRCDCGAVAELTEIEGRIKTCLECHIRWWAASEPLSEVLAIDAAARIGELYGIAFAYAEAAERARTVNMHDRRFYLERARVHARAARALESETPEGGVSPAIPTGHAAAQGTSAPGTSCLAEAPKSQAFSETSEARAAHPGVNRPIVGVTTEDSSSETHSHRATRPSGLTPPAGAPREPAQFDAGVGQ